MNAARQAQVAFYLTGKRPGGEPEPVDSLGLRPALLARYHDLATLRYAYPLVLLPDSAPESCARPLSAMVDEALAEAGPSQDEDGLAPRAFRIETAIRRSMKPAGSASLVERWREAVRDFGVADGDSPGRARLAGLMQADGQLLNCDEALPARLVAHVWQAAQQRKSMLLRQRVERLSFELSEILRADFAMSDAGRSPEALKASFGGSQAQAFDFSAMSGMLSSGSGGSTLSPGRRQRLETMISLLNSVGEPEDELSFDSCVDALEAWQARYPRLVRVIRAITAAELEIAGEYREATHDLLLASEDGDNVAPEEISSFPDLLVRLNAADMDASEQAALMEILSSGAPVKVLVQTDDVLPEFFPETGKKGFGRSAPHFANMAVGLNDVYVMQASASHLPRMLAPLARGMDYPGAALISVFSGAGQDTGDVPPYLISAAAVESRAFPLFVYDPGAGADWASRFSVAANPQPEADWPVSEFEYESSGRRRVIESLAFTLVDFVALDNRFQSHLARLPQAGDSDFTIPVSEALEAVSVAEPEKLPVIMMVDDSFRLHRVLADERLLRAARRCREAWHSLQELGGIHNSHAARLLAEARARDTQTEAVAHAAREEAAGASLSGDLTPAAAPQPEPESGPGDAAAHSPDEPYIETPRCTTCNECTQINDKMFAYNENQQAYVKDPDAGTYAQLVEAAESCQVAIIHPGKPRNPDEPGLEDLVRRAEAFL